LKFYYMSDTGPNFEEAKFESGFCHRCVYSPTCTLQGERGLTDLSALYSKVTEGRVEILQGKDRK
jgi:hypothetical protein